MKRISYEVVQTKRGFDAVKRTAWPDRDPSVHPPVSVRLNSYPTREAAAEACHYDADWQAIVDADAGHSSEIICTVWQAIAEQDAAEAGHKSE